MNAHLVRTVTAPAGPPQARLQTSNSSASIHQYDNPHHSHNSTNSQPSRSSERSSDSTQNTTSSTLFPFPTAHSQPLSSPSPAPNAVAGGPVLAADHVMNKAAAVDESLFQKCKTLRDRLRDIPGFEDHCLRAEQELKMSDQDPSMILFHVFGKGYPLLSIYNVLNPADPLTVDEGKVKEGKRAQAAIYKFTQACVQVLGFPQQDCFMVTDLKANDRGEPSMAGLNKAVRQVGKIVDIMVTQGILTDHVNTNTVSGPAGKKTHMQHVVDELVRTERTYVQHLRLLQAFERQVKQSGVVSGDVVHAIFLNLDPLLEFQEHFLVRVEQVNAQPEAVQNWGRLFLHYASTNDPNEKRKDFSIYVPYIENNRHCESTMMREFEKLKQAGGSVELQQIVESPTSLTSFLLKPFQRISKYPLLLREMRDKGDFGEHDSRRKDVADAMDAMNAVLNQTNELVHKAERDEAVKDLKAQVEDWKHHRVEAFGDLLLYGTHTVVKGDPKTDSEREYRMYLFEKILLCCKEMNPNKAKNKVRAVQTASMINGKPRLQLKGRIFMQNVTETTCLIKPAQYTCKIFWRGDETIESFFIRFNKEEDVRTWTAKIETQRRVCLDQARLTNPRAENGEQFIFMQQAGAIENPIRDEDGDDFDNPGYAESTSSQFSASRNASNTSLRGRERAGTGESGYGRQVRPTMPSGTLSGLSLRTQPAGMISPSESAHKGASYFSPGAESPVSSRGSTASSIMGFPRQVMPPNESRYTAPARGDANGAFYDHYGRALSGPHGRELAAYRNRSFSNSDAASRKPSHAAPPVPTVPSHLTNGGGYGNRSRTSSPMSPEAFTKQPAGYHRQQDYAQPLPTGDPFVSDEPPLSVNTAATTVSPPLPSAATFDGSSQPSQLRVKVKLVGYGVTVMLVVAYSITFDKLKDRIDAKLQRSADVSLSSGSVALKYEIEGEFIKIESEDDMQLAFETGCEKARIENPDQAPEIELLCGRN